MKSGHSGSRWDTAPNQRNSGSRHGLAGHGGSRVHALVGARVAATIGLELAAERPSDHWVSGNDWHFVEKERELRDLNRQAARLKHESSLSISASGETGVLYDAFVSHSFRCGQTQELKRRLITEISKVREGGRKPGLVYWADFLDLAERGPVPWRKEIEEGIRSSSKMLAFIDEQFLTSYNCIMEVAAAFEMHKPVVPIILDQNAWALLTTPHGAEVAWQRSAELRSYDGQEFLGGPLFSLTVLKSVFKRVANINFCSARPVDISHWGIDYVIERFNQDVTKDLPYLKEWTQLNEQALAWFSTGRQNSSLLGRNGLEKWEVWIAQAEKYGMEPLPTYLHAEYVKESSSFFVRRKRWLVVAGVVVLMLILAGAITSTVMGHEARKAAGEAREQAAIAEEKSKLATLSQHIAERNVNLAAILLLGGSVEPNSGRDKRALLKAFEVARDIDRVDMVTSQLQSAVRHLAYEPFWSFELEGHINARAVKFSPDGRFLLSGGGDYTYRVWPIVFQQGSFMPVPLAPEMLTCVDGESLTVDWSVKGLIAGGNGDHNTICIWEQLAGVWTLREKIRPAGSPDVADVWVVSFSPTGNHLAAGSSDGGLYIYDLITSPSTVRTIVAANETSALEEQFRAAAWTPDERYLITGGIGRELKVWDLQHESGAEVVIRHSTNGDVTSISVFVEDEMGDGSSEWSSLRVAVASDMSDSKSYTWFFTLEQAAGGGVVLDLEHNVEVESAEDAQWSPVDGSLLAISAQDNFVQLWNVDTAVNQTTGSTFYTLNHSQLVYDVVTRPRSLTWGRQPPSDVHILQPVDMLATATASGTIYIFQRAVDLRERGPRLDRLYCHLAEERGVKHSVRGNAVSSDLTQLVTSAFHGSICFWKRDPETLKWANTHVTRVNDVEQVQAKREAQWSPNNELLGVAVDDGSVIIYDMTGEEPVEVSHFTTHQSATRVVAFDPSSQYATSAGRSEDPTVLVWRVRAPVLQLRMVGHTDVIRHVEWVSGFDVDGAATLASVGDDSVIRIWDIQRADNGELSLTSSMELGRMEGARYAHCQASTAVGLLACGDTSGEVSLWKIRKGDEAWALVHRATVHTTTVDRVQWLGGTLVSGSKDETLNHIEVDPVTWDVLRTYKTNVDCRKPFAVLDGITVPRVACLRTGSNAAGHQYSDMEAEVTVEVEQVLVGFEDQFSIFRRMVYGRLDLSDLVAMGYQDLTHVIDSGR